jgi:uncharacterized membrane protein
MKKELWYETLIVAITLAPFIWLAAIWNTMPEQVPVHFNYKGEPDRFNSKKELIFILALMGPLTWALLKYLPKIDPRNKLAENPSVLRNIRLVLTLFTSAIGVVIILSALDGGKSITTLIPVLVGGLFAGLGNYLINIKPNYFVGIRTPWTLENENVWRRTHRVGGKMMFWGGLAVAALAFVVPDQYKLLLLLAAPICLAIVPVVLSYFYYKEETR